MTMLLYRPSLLLLFLSLLVSSVDTAPTVCSDLTTLGYDTLASLQVDLDDTTQQEETMFVLCPFTTFHNDHDHDVLLIQRNRGFNSTLNVFCGQTGQSSERCVLNNTKIRVVSNETPVLLHGLTFENNGFVEIVGDAFVEMMDCHWEGITPATTNNSSTINNNNSIVLLREEIYSDRCLETEYPSYVPSQLPSLTPTGVILPSLVPSTIPSLVPSLIPSNSSNSTANIPNNNTNSSIPSMVPSLLPSLRPSFFPSLRPSLLPSLLPSTGPSLGQSQQPSRGPSVSPSLRPTSTPTMLPSRYPSTIVPTLVPTTLSPSLHPSRMPSVTPTTFAPSRSLQPSPNVTSLPPTNNPSLSTPPSDGPTRVPTDAPSVLPSTLPSAEPTQIPTQVPTQLPTTEPSLVPTQLPSLFPSSSPSTIPSSIPSTVPSLTPSVVPSLIPSTTPSLVPSGAPSLLPSTTPSQLPSTLPTVVASLAPSIAPSLLPSLFPSLSPTLGPSALASLAPSAQNTDDNNRSPVFNKTNECPALRVLMKDCTFYDTTAERALVVQQGGSLSLERSMLSFNTAPTLVDSAGVLFLSNNSFIDNNLLDAPVVLRQHGSTVNVPDQLLENEFNCANNEVNTSSLGSCGGVFLPNTTECIEFDTSLRCVIPSSMPSLSLTPSVSTEPSLSIAPSFSALPSSTLPSMLPSIVPTRSALTELCPDGISYGYTNYQHLQADLDEGLTDQDIVLCAGSVFRGDLVADFTESTTMSCTSVCDWQGSWSVTTSSTLLIGGLNFRLATNVTLEIQYSTPNADVRINECTFEDNAGVAAVLIGPTPVDVNASTKVIIAHRHRRHDPVSYDRALQTGAPEVRLQKCSFTRNRVGDVISNLFRADLTIFDTSFSNNDATGTMINSPEGRTTITNVRFVDNTVGAEQGVAVLRQDAIVTPDSGQSITCATSLVNENKTCAGIVLKPDCLVSPCDPICQDLRECPPPGCIFSWGRLLAAIANGTDMGFAICPDTVLNLAIDPRILEIDGSNNTTTIKCGFDGLRSNNCVIDGGDVQIRHVGNASKLIVEGMTFVSSSQYAVVAAGGATSQVEFRDCEFSGHRGEAAVWATQRQRRVRRMQVGATQDSVDGGRDALEGSSTLHFDRCLFQDNEVRSAPVVSTDGIVSVGDSIFLGNFGEIGAIHSISSSELSLSSSCFIDNEGDLGTVFLDSSSSIADNDENFGLRNSLLSGDCADIEVEGLACVGFTSTRCRSPLSEGVNFFALYSDCLLNYTELSAALNSTESAVLCPGSTLNLTTPIKITKSGTIIKCGSDGSRQNECVVSGGGRQIEILDPVEDVLIQGLTFRGATESSVFVDTVSPMSVDFIDCAWEQASGESAIVVVSNDLQTGGPTIAPTIFSQDDDVLNSTLNLNTPEAPDAPTAGVSFDQCTFESNNVASNLIRGVRASITVSSSTFAANSAGGSIVGAEDSHVTLSAACFDGNNVDGGDALVSGDTESTIQFTSTFSANNQVGAATACEGVVDPFNGACQVFNSTFCEAAVSVVCFSDWEELRSAIILSESLGQGGVFTMCEESAVDVVAFSPIEITSNNVIVRCGSKGERMGNCVFVGGTVQFLIAESAKGIEFQGLFFKGTSSSAIHVEAADSVVTISDCVFFAHSGPSVLVIGELDGLASGRSLQLAAPVGVNVQGSFFQDNAVTIAPIVVRSGIVTISGTVFDDNVGDVGAVRILPNGTVSISGSCFIRNNAISEIVSDDGATLTQVGNFANSTASNTNCTGVQDGTACTVFDAETCTLPSVVIVPPPGGCYADWSSLSDAVGQGPEDVTQELLFRICANTTLDAPSASSAMVLEIREGIVTLQCGDKGLLDDNCTISGGQSHLKISASPTINIRGMTFVGATFASIMATGSRDALLSMEDCTFKENAGQSVVLIHNEATAGDPLAVTDLEFLKGPPEGSSSMTVLIDSCTFEANSAAFATIVNNGGNLNLIETSVVDNQVARFGSVAAVHRSTTGMSFSCFSRNAALVRGIVFIDKTSNTTFARNSFGEDNTVQLSPCNSVFLESEGSCFETATCKGECQEFDARTCRIKLLQENGTLAPTVAPTPGPENGVPGGGEPGANKDDSGFVGSAGFIVLMILLPLCCCLLCGIGGFFFWRQRQSRFEIQPLVDLEKDESKGDLLVHATFHDDSKCDSRDDDSLSSRSTDVAADDADGDDYDDDDSESWDDRERFNSPDVDDDTHNDERRSLGQSLA